MIAECTVYKNRDVEAKNFHVASLALFPRVENTNAAGVALVFLTRGISDDYYPWH
jgi:hypothetical protein